MPTNTTSPVRWMHTYSLLCIQPVLKIESLDIDYICIRSSFGSGWLENFKSWCDKILYDDKKTYNYSNAIARLHFLFISRRSHVASLTCKLGTKQLDGNLPEYFPECHTRFSMRSSNSGVGDPVLKSKVKVLHEKFNTWKLPSPNPTVDLRYLVSIWG